MTWGREECDAYWPIEPPLPTVEYDDPEEVARLYGPNGEVLLVLRSETVLFGFQPDTQGSE
jgi:hypothetical protein